MSLPGLIILALIATAILGLGYVIARKQSQNEKLEAQIAADKQEVSFQEKVNEIQRDSEKLKAKVDEDPLAAYRDLVNRRVPGNASDPKGNDTPKT